LASASTGLVDIPERHMYCHVSAHNARMMQIFVVASVWWRLQRCAVCWKRSALIKRRCWRDLRNTIAPAQVRRHVTSSRVSCNSCFYVNVSLILHVTCLPCMRRSSSCTKGIYCSRTKSPFLNNSVGLRQTGTDRDEIIGYR